MKDPTLIKIDGIQYRKSSHSVTGGNKCVGVAVEKNTVKIINTVEKGSIVRFTLDEWEAFIAGVKDGEFDLE